MNPTYWTVAGGMETVSLRGGLFLSPDTGSEEEGKRGRMEGFVAGEDLSLGDIAHVPHG